MERAARGRGGGPVVAGAAGFRLKGVVDGDTDALAVYRGMKEAVALARAGHGPTLVEAKTYRLTPHSSDDDDRSYRTREEVELWKKRDPILRLRQVLEAAGLLSRAEQEALEARAVAEVDDAVKVAQESPY